MPNMWRQLVQRRERLRREDGIPGKEGTTSALYQLYKRFKLPSGVLDRGPA